MRIVPRLILLVLLTLVSGLLPEPVGFVRAFQEGHALRGRMEYRAALASFEKAQAFHRQSALPSLWMARTYLDLGMPAKALQLFREAFNRGAGGPDLFVDWGRAFHELGDVERAAHLWQGAVGPDGRWAAGYFRLGMAALEGDDWARAAEGLEAALKRDMSEEDTQTARYWLGILYTLVDHTAAAACLAEAGRGPDPLLAERAEFIAGALTRPLPAHQTRAGLLGATLFNLEHWTVAQAHLQAALIERPTDVEILAYLGALQSRRGHSAEAAHYLRQALALAPDHPLVLFFWGRHHVQVGALDAARAAFEQVLQIDGRNPAVCVEIAKTYVRQGDYEEAQGWFEQAVQRAPADVGFHLALAEFEAETLYDVARGLAAAQAAVELEPDNPVAYDLLGWLLFLSRKWDAAEHALQRALVLEPGLMSAYYHLGRLYEAEQRFGQARWAFGRAVDLGRGHPSQSLAGEALQRLGRGPEVRPRRLPHM